MLDRRHDLPPGRAIRTELVGNDALRQTALLLHKPDQQALGCLGVATGLNDLVENIPILVDGTPKPMFASTDDNDHLVQMPDIIRARRLAIPRSSSSSSTRRRLSGNRKYSQTAWANTDGGKRWRL